MTKPIDVDADLIQKALDFATLKHAGQTRKFSGLPYVTHPINVSAIVQQYCRSDKNYTDLVIAALAHDLLEDCDVKYSELVSLFGPIVANLVRELSNDEDELTAIGKTEYMKKKFVNLTDSALVIKLADRLDNAQDNMPEKTKVATKEILTHLIANRILTFTQKQLFDAILDEIK